MKDAKTGNGKYLNVEMTVVEGQYDGKKIFARLNLINANKEAVRIAKGQFAALREAVGVLEPKDSSELENIRFQVELKCVKRKDNDQMSNEIAKYIKKGQSATTPQQNNGNAPWAKNAPKPGEEPPAVADADVPF